ncbi:hypothetical protein GLV94_01555 [Virgibacillus halodenitrificans]|uniref:hypothetical protein n=1 Tax=Virgibacillus halodenitrificans TaxID=1482 RepID=UPI0013711B37|nr:hypothetical protein [Virgibacillus halodenitrificans]MYL44320.1 hypothetical protein [Virgibacillus halodenitrificans]
MKQLGPIGLCDGRTYCSYTNDCYSYIGHLYVQTVDCRTGEYYGSALKERCGCRFS